MNRGETVEGRISAEDFDRLVTLARAAVETPEGR